MLRWLWYRLSHPPERFTVTTKVWRERPSLPTQPVDDLWTCAEYDDAMEQAHRDMIALQVTQLATMRMERVKQTREVDYSVLARVIQ